LNALKMEAVCFSETLSTYKSTRRYNPENKHPVPLIFHIALLTSLPLRSAWDAAEVLLVGGRRKNGELKTDGLHHGNAVP
jgi:hypothetical protein